VPADAHNPSVLAPRLQNAGGSGTNRRDRRGVSSSARATPRVGCDLRAMRRRPRRGVPLPLLLIEVSRDLRGFRDLVDQRWRQSVGGGG
jgi:hypothetical protein